MDYYEEFGVPPSASTEQIRQAHKRLARLFHPDRIQEAELRSLAESQMKRFNAIRAVLCDPRRRLQYDLSLARGEDDYTLPRASLGLGRWRFPAWLAIAAVCVAGIVWLLHARPEARPAVAAAGSSSQRLSTNAFGLPVEPVPHQERLSPPPSMPDREDTLKRRNADLERALESAISDRDGVVADLARLREELKLARSPSALTHVDPLLSPARPENVMPPVPDVPDAPSAPSRDIAGTWFYVPRRDAPAPEHTYPPEYIEAVITSDGTQVRGRYRGRYVVADRAISPEVAFQFRGEQNDEGRYRWTGQAGAVGEVRLELMSDDLLRVEWLASSLGEQLDLASGSALLTRRRDP